MLGHARPDVLPPDVATVHLVARIGDADGIMGGWGWRLADEEFEAVLAAVDAPSGGGGSLGRIEGGWGWRAPNEQLQAVLGAVGGHG